MQINALARRALHLVFVLSSSSSALSRPRLEQRLGVSAAELNTALGELARLGLLDVQRLRLTMAGLVLAAASRKSQESCKPSVTAEPQAPIQLFSHRESARAVA
jgi:Mn-dependent DtxR family transcriptional regulator